MSSLSGFVQRNKTAVIATTAVVAVGVGLGIYYAAQSAPPTTQSQEQNKSSVDSGDEGASTASQKKKKNDKKKKKKQQQQNKEESKELYGIPLTRDSEDGPEYPVVTPTTELRGIAIEELNELAALLKAAGNGAFAKKEYERAVELYTSAIRCNENDPVFYSNRAACYNSLKKYEQVVEDTTKALAIRPDYAKCLSRRAVAYEKLGKFKEAIFDFTASCILGGFADQSMNNSVDRVLKLEAEKIAKEEYSEISTDLPSANFIKSYLTSFRPRELPQSVKDAPVDTGDYYLKLAFDALDQETSASYEQAYEYFKKAIDANAENIDLALEYRGTFKFLLGDSEVAMKDIEQSIEVKPSVQAYIKRSSIHMENGDIESAKKDFEAAVQLNPLSPDIYYHRAQISFLTSDFNAAVRDYEQSASLDEDFMFSHIQLAVTQYRMQSVQTAVASFRKLLKRYPDSSDVHNYYGEILLDQGDHQEAIKQFDTAIELESSKSIGAINVLSLVNKSLAIFQQTQDLTQAEAVCRKAAALDPLSDIAIATLAQYCLQQGKTDEALGFFKRNAEIARSHPERVQALQYAEAAKTQLRIMRERPELRQRLDAFSRA